MTLPLEPVYTFGPFSLDTAERLLTRDGLPVQLTPKAFDVLLVLVENHGRVVEKRQLMDAVWPDAFVEEGNLKATVAMVRKAIEGVEDETRYIETVPRRGYRFAAAVARVVPTPEEVGAAGAAGDVDRPAETPAPPLERSPDAPRRWVRVAVVACAVAAVAIAAYAFRSRTPLRPPGVRSLAVLPFKPVLHSADDEYLEIGLADTLITRLSCLHDIAVRPTSAVRKYSSPDQDAVEAGRELDVDAVVDGSVQRAGDRIRVSVRLVRTADGASLWADQFDQDTADVFRVQDAISRQIVSALALTLTTGEQDLLAKPYTANSEAYDAYLKGRYFWNKRGADGLAKSIEYYRRAIDLDPNYALAYAGLADSLNMVGYWGIQPPPEVFPSAKQTALRALGIDDTLAEAHAALGYALFEYDWNASDAEAEYKRALVLSPNVATIHERYFELLFLTRRFAEADAELDRARALDPLSLPVLVAAGSELYLQRRYQDAIRQLEQGVELDPSYSDIPPLLGMCYWKAGMPDKAVAARLAGYGPDERAAIQARIASEGPKGLWRGDAEMLEAESAKTYVPPLAIAIDYAAAGDGDRAMVYLDRAYDERCGWLLELGFDPVWDDLRSDPRFVNLVHRVGLER